MSRAVVMVAVAALAGCKDDGPRTLSIERKLETKSTVSTARPGVGGDHDPTPALAISGGDPALVDVMRAELSKSALVRRGNVAITVATTPDPPAVPSGTTTVSLSVTATYLHAPKLSHLVATVTGPIKYSGATRGDLGAELAKVVIGYLESAKIPANTAPATIAPATRVTVGPPNCTLHDDASVRCWERDEAPVVLPALAGTIALDSGNQYGVCGVRDNGRAYCVDAWDNTISYEARGVCGVSDATAISVGLDAACARIVDGTVRCWSGGGPKWFEPCGKTQAREIKNVRGATSVDVGFKRACSVIDDGGVMCWDLDAAVTATRVKGLEKATRVVVGFETCAIVNDAKVRCVRDGKARDVALPEGAVQLAIGGIGTCALGAFGHVYCWIGERPPAIVSGVNDAIDIGGDITGMCAVTKAHDVVCWNKDSEGSPPKRVTFTQ